MARRLVLGDLSSQSQFCFCLKLFNDLLFLFLGCCFLHYSGIKVSRSEERGKGMYSLLALSLSCKEASEVAPFDSGSAKYHSFLSI